MRLLKICRGRHRIMPLHPPLFVHARDVLSCGTGMESNLDLVTASKWVGLKSFVSGRDAVDTVSCTGMVCILGGQFSSPNVHLVDLYQKACLDIFIWGLWEFGIEWRIEQGSIANAHMNQRNHSFTGLL